ncbi:type IV secretion system protein TraC [Vibrio sp. SCSIO 43169]|uniref:type IV secretion system protein TraC n=1 Tax=Vibrio sp. SCSIO 43169 TaxID=2822801 RepID=UPI002042F40D|nr:type IV secretion system protein TraC [Vibrio sp. SCSIO 43169]MCM5511353.1 type IV secretion system protein TraC [Vibrio sp. SCSIO 43169]
MSESAFWRSGWRAFGNLRNEARKHRPRWHQWLPYRDFDSESMLFINTRSRGFGLALVPLSGANDELVESLNKWVSDLPQGRGWDYQFILHGHNRVGHWLDANAREMAQRGGVCADLAEQERRYAHYAAQHGYMHHQRAHYDLRDYDAYFFMSTSTASPSALVQARAQAETVFHQLGLAVERVEPAKLLTLLRDLIHFDPAQERPETATYNPLEPLNDQVLAADAELYIHRDRIDTQWHTRQGENARCRQVHLGLTALPHDFRLYALPECLSSIRNVARQVPCPHLICVSFRQEPTGQAEYANNRKIADLTKTVQSKLALFLPSAADELDERRELQKGLSNRQYTLSSMCVGVSLFCRQDDHQAAVQATKEAFGANGLELRVLPMIQAQCLMATLPFMMSEGLWDDCQKTGRIRTIKSSNVVNFFPIVMDRRRLTGGVLLPTLRGQISFFDPFRCGSDNHNIALNGGSGAGKSFFVEQLAKTVFAQGGKVWVLDKGASYKKLTLLLDGVHLDHRHIFLNPFTHLEAMKSRGTEQPETDSSADGFGPIKEALSNITALFATMAAPYQPLDSFQLAILGDAIVQAWQRAGAQTCVDDVQHALRSLAQEQQHDRRIEDIAVQLNKYATQGVYGDTFNRPSLLDPAIDMTTLELDGFNDDVLRPVIFALMVSINQQMYLSGERARRKLCIIEEAWNLLSGNNAQARLFINTGYRTARKFGGAFCTVTQGIDDAFASAEAKACYDNSDIHIMLRQGEGFEAYLRDNPTAFSPLDQHILKHFPRAQEAGYSAVRIKAGGHVSYHRIFADPLTRAYLSTEPHEYAWCEQQMAAGVPLKTAIAATAKHFYGDELDRFEHAMASDTNDPRRTP